MDIGKLFELVVSSSLMGSVLVLIVLLIKSIFREKLNRYFHYYIWLLVIIRLLLPYSYQSRFSIYNVLNHVAGSSISVNTSDKAADFELFKNSKSISDELQKSAEEPASESRKYDVKNIMGVIWLLGLAFFTFNTIRNAVKVKGIVANSVDFSCSEFDKILKSSLLAARVNKKVKLVYTNKICTPSLFGIINPIIIIPIRIAEKIDHDEFKYIVLHELSHLKRKDLLIIWSISLLRCVYWFNPIVLYGLHRMKQDCELACDLHTISYLEDDENIKYGNTLIRIAELGTRDLWIP